MRLIEVYDGQRGWLGSMGPFALRGEGYKPWVFARAALGSRDDTLFVVSLENGLIRHYQHDGNTLLDEFRLPEYFRPIAPREEVVRFPWIQYGELEYVFHAPQLRGAVFRPDGMLYTIRSYDYSWIPRPNPYVQASGRWESGQEGLEVYTPTGMARGTFDIPGTVRLLGVDSFGRLFLGLRSGDVRVFQDPVASPTRCEARDARLPATGA